MRAGVISDCLSAAHRVARFCRRTIIVLVLSTQYEGHLFFIAHEEAVLTPALQLEILDLRHFSAASLRPLLEAESRLWSERLEWDYRSSADLLLQYLDSRLLPGYVAIENGRVSGYVFCVYEEHKAVIGDVFAIKSQYSDTSSTEIESRLLENLIELLKGSPGVERIESQLLLHPSGEQTDVFQQNGFCIYARLFMRLGLSRAKTYATPSAPAGYHIRQWREDDFNNAAHLIADAYQDHLDSHINDQYRSVGGSLRFLHNIIRFPGCGFFDASASRVLVHTATNRLGGLLLCSRVREDVGHITQLCVSKEIQGLGTGAMLMEHSASYLASHGFKSLTLTVTEGNRNAVRLYERVGFETMHRFDAMLWEKSNS